jgi:hypothetical protein
MTEGTTGKAAWERQKKTELNSFSYLKPTPEITKPHLWYPCDLLKVPLLNTIIMVIKFQHEFQNGHSNHSKLYF